MADDSTEDVRMMLAQKVFDSTIRNTRSLERMESMVTNIDSRTKDDHDALLAMKLTMESLKESGRDTSSGINVLAGLAQKADKREEKLQEAEAKASENRWQFVTDNWKILAVLAVAVLAPNMLPTIFSALGMQAAPVAALAAPAPEVVIPPHPHPDPAASKEEATP